jgi:membrane protein YqaA with SNARE-associated domain
VDVTRLPRPAVLRSVSFFWGVAEATFFFFVPDIWLSRIAVLGSLREAWLNSFLAALGAILGGCILYVAAQMAFPAVTHFLVSIPAISDGMVAAAGVHIAQGSFVQSLFAGALTGVPYKIYASWAGHLSVPLYLFLAATFCARLFRFMTIILLYRLVAAGLHRFVRVGTVHAAYVFSWLAFYAVYFTVFSGAGG